MNPKPRQVILAAHFPGVNNHTVWQDPEAGSQIAFSSFAHLARTAERGLFDFFFLAEGLRLREQRGEIYDLDVVGRPETFTVLSALAAVTDRLGLAGTINATFNEPYEVARKFATLDHLSGGRAGWNVVTSPNAFTGANFRRGGYLDHADRYRRAEEFVRAARELWDSWPEDEPAADPASGAFLNDPEAGRFSHHGPEFDIEGHFTVPRSPQGHTVIIQAGDSDAGRDFAARTADAIFTRHGTLEAGLAFAADIRAKLARHGRAPGELKILPGVAFVLGDTEREARERRDHIRRQQVGPQTAIALLEQVWDTDLSGYDPDGPLPDFDPDPAAGAIIQGRARQHDDKIATARRWRTIAADRGLSIRELVIEITDRQRFTGTPASVAAEIDEFVRRGAADGFILVPHLVPGGLDEFVDKVVPLLQERGVFRTSYATTTLRDHLGLPPAGRAAGGRTAASA